MPTRYLEHWLTLPRKLTGQSPSKQSRGVAGLLCPKSSLPPEISSTLGSMIGGKHFTAYHNFFHGEQGEVRHVVVPFEPQEKLAKQFAARALIETALNPTGNGWY